MLKPVSASGCQTQSVDIAEKPALDPQPQGLLKLKRENSLITTLLLAGGANLYWYDKPLYTQPCTKTLISSEKLAAPEC